MEHCYKTHGSSSKFLTVVEASVPQVGWFLLLLSGIKKEWSSIVTDKNIVSYRKIKISVLIIDVSYLSKMPAKSPLYWECL